MSIEAIRELETLASVCPELNMANYTEDDVRHLNDWAIEMSLLAEKVAAIQQAEVTDQLIESEFQRCGGKWNGDQWVIEDADLHPFCRAILALRPAAVPMTDAEASDMIRETVRGNAIRREGSTSLQIVRATERYYGITAQAKKETP